MNSNINPVLFVIVLAATIGCSDKRSAKEFLSDPEKQEEVLTEIANDSILLVKLHDKMKTGKMGMPMKSCMSMMDDPQMMSMMMDHMVMVCENDSMKGRMMCDKMMNAPNMKSMMRSMMDSEKGTN